jgi:hypothetical protein
MNGRPRAAYLFAKEAAQIPYPHQDILFIDNNVYKWMALDELAATAFYTHDYKNGHAACEILLKQNRLPPSEVERNQKNHAAYTEQIEKIQAAQKQSANSIPLHSVTPAQTASLLNNVNKVNMKTFKKRRK